MLKLFLKSRFNKILIVKNDIILIKIKPIIIRLINVSDFFFFFINRINPLIFSVSLKKKKLIE